VDVKGHIVLGVVFVFGDPAVLAAVVIALKHLLPLFDPEPPAFTELPPVRRIILGAPLSKTFGVAEVSVVAVVAGVSVEGRAAVIAVVFFFALPERVVFAGLVL